MRTTAQYKVVDDIAAGFKMDIWDFADYMDMWIAFPKRQTKPRRRSRKSSSDAPGRGIGETKAILSPSLPDRNPRKHPRDTPAPSAGGRCSLATLAPPPARSRSGAQQGVVR
jgi:hypothetical protein